MKQTENRELQDLSCMSLVDKLEQEWQSQLQADYPQQSPAVRDSIVCWLIGEDRARYEQLTPEQQVIAEQAIDYRYRILRQRYLGVGPERAYRSLIQRLGSLFLIRNKIRTWVALSRDRQRSVVDVLQEVIQELLQSDGYMQQQLAWIAKCTTDPRLRNSLLLTSTEEYCLRPIRNQPLLVYRFVNYLRRSQRAGMTQVPSGDLVRLVSEEIVPDEADNPVSLLDAQAIARYQEEQEWEQQQRLRLTVQREFAAYLAENVDATASEWLRLYLRGYSQEAIAKALNMPIKQVYRLREKISYHAVRVFALKNQPELVANWLEISLQEHSLGLTPEQWRQYYDTLTPEQQQLLDKLKAGKSLEAIGKDLNLKTNQIAGEWSKLYLTAQEFRTAT